MNKTEQKEQTVERIELQGTPFHLVKWETEWMITLGDYVLMKGFQTAQDAEMATETQQWLLMGAFIYAMIDHYEKEKTRK